MRYFYKAALQIVAVAAVLVLAVSASAGQAGTGGDEVRNTPAQSGNQIIQLAAHGTTVQTAALPTGTIRLRVIPRIGGKAIRQQINWRVETYGRDAAGKRHDVTEVTGPTPELVLPAGWYIVHAQLTDKKIKHPVEVTAGRTFHYTLVKN